MKLVEMWMTYLSKQKKTKNEAKCVVASSEVNKWKVIFIRSKWRICQWWLHPSSWMTNATFPVFFVVSEPVLLYTSNSTSDENRFLFMVGRGGKQLMLLLLKRLNEDIQLRKRSTGSLVGFGSKVTGVRRQHWPLNIDGIKREYQLFHWRLCLKQLCSSLCAYE